MDLIQEIIGLHTCSVVGSTSSSITVVVVVHDGSIVVVG